MRYQPNTLPQQKTPLSQNANVETQSCEEQFWKNCNRRTHVNTTISKEANILANHNRAQGG